MHFEQLCRKASNADGAGQNVWSRPILTFLANGRNIEQIEHLIGRRGCPLLDYERKTPVSRQLMQAFRMALFNELQRATADLQE